MSMVDSYKVIPVEVDHFFQLDPRDYDAKAAFSHLPNPRASIMNYISSSYAFTGFHEDDIIGIAGVTPLWPGVAEAWLFSGASLPKHVRFVLRQLRHHLATAEELFGVRRIQAVVYGDFADGHKFIERLGFVCETPSGLKNYGREGETYKMYARYNG